MSPSDFYSKMDPNKKVIEKVPRWFKLYNDGSVDWTWTGPPEVEFMMKPVPPHQEFINGLQLAM